MGVRRNRLAAPEHLPQLPPLTTVLDTPRHLDRTPLVVAPAGSGVAALLLLLTLFTVQRVRARRT